MKASLFALLAASLTARLVAAPLVPATNAVAPAGDVIVARGQGFVIRRHQMDQVLATARVGDAQANAALGRTNAPADLPPEAELHVLSQLMEIQLVMQQTTPEERAAGRQKTDATFTNILQTMGAAKFEAQLKATLMTPDELRRMLYEEETAQASLTRQLGVQVTDDEAKKYFDDYPGAFDQPKKAHIRELLLYTTLGYTSESLPEDAILAKHQQIYELYRRFQAGEDFAALARQYNEDIASKGAGGEVSFTADQMEKVMGDLAFAMQAGQVSQVITNGDGYVFFQLLEIIPAKQATFAELADKIKKNLTGEHKRQLAPAYLEKLKQEANVEILDPRLKAMMAGAGAKSRPPGTGQ